MMLVGKNKKVSKVGKKKYKNNVLDPLYRKNWYDVKTTNMFATGQTLVNCTQGKRIFSDYF